MDIWSIVAIVIILILTIIVVIKNDAEAEPQISKTLHQWMNPSLYGKIFKEEKYQITSKIIKKQIKNGYNSAKSKSVVFCALCTSVEDQKSCFRKLIKRVDYLSEPWKKSHLILVVPNSIGFNNEESLINSIFEDQQKFNFDISIVSYDPQILRLTKFCKLSTLRNLYLDKLCKDEFLSKTDYTIVLDIDLQGPVSRDGLIHSSEILKDGYYDALFGYGIRINYLNIQIPYFGASYYDTSPTIYKNDIDVENGGFFILNEWRDNEIKGKHFKGMFTLNRNRDDKIVDVASSFSGVAIYKTWLFTEEKIRYRPDCRVCEHIPLHFEMIKRGLALGINPAMMCLTGNYSN